MDSLVLNLYANLFILRSYELKIAKNEFGFSTYYELIQKLESINFNTPQQLFEEIKNHNDIIKKYGDEEDDEDD